MVTPKQMHLVSDLISSCDQTVSPVSRSAQGHSGSRHYSRHSRSPRHPLLTVQRRRNAATAPAASCPSKSKQDCVRRSRIRTQTGYLARRVCADGARNVQSSLSGSGAPLTCVRALSGFGMELQGVSRQRASPGISVSSLTAFDLLGLASKHGCACAHSTCCALFCQVSEQRMRP